MSEQDDWNETVLKAAATHNGLLLLAESLRAERDRLQTAYEADDEMRADLVAMKYLVREAMKILKVPNEDKNNPDAWEQWAADWITRAREKAL